MTRAIGILLIVASVVVCLMGGVWLIAQQSSGTGTIEGTVLGFALLVVFVVTPLAGGGVFALVRGRGEQAEKAEADAQRKILDMIKTRGEVSISDIIIELQSDLSSVQAMIYKLVGMGVFSGYVNWDEGTLYSAEISALRETTQCKHCGGALSLAGKGVLKCPFCDTEYFLAQ